MTEYHQKSYSLGGDEGLNGGDPEEQTFTNLNCKHLHLNVTIQVGDQNQVNILASKSDLTPASTCSDQSFSSDSVDEPDYMDMSNAPDTPPSWSLSSGSCGNNQAFYETYSSTYRRYDSFWSSNDLNNSDITLSEHETSSSGSGFPGFSETPDLQPDGLLSMSDTIPDNQKPKRLSLPIPERFLSEAAQSSTRLQEGRGCRQVGDFRSAPTGINLKFIFCCDLLDEFLDSRLTVIGQLLFAPSPRNHVTRFSSLVT